MTDGLEVLISCMHRNDFSIIDSLHLNGVQTLLVDQCDTQSERIIEEGSARMLLTNTRGLSVSRNIGIENAIGDVCLFGDDDELFADDLENIILDSYKRHNDADMIVFRMIDREPRLGKHEKRLRGLDYLKVASCQISFRRNAVAESGVRFDPLLGAGSGNGASEENKFMRDCMRAGLKAVFVPIPIASAVRTSSTWFGGFDETYFFNRGRTTRYILGLPVALLYAAYFIVFKYKKYSGDINAPRALAALIKGLFAKKIGAAE